MSDCMLPSLSIGNFLEMIDDDKLNVSDEVIVFRAIVIWSFENQNRKHLIYSLMKVLRYARIKYDDLTEILNHPLVTQQKQTLELVTKFISNYQDFHGKYY